MSKRSYVSDPFGKHLRNFEKKNSVRSKKTNTMIAVTRYSSQDPHNSLIPKSGIIYGTMKDIVRLWLKSSPENLFDLQTRAHSGQYRP